MSLFAIGFKKFELDVKKKHKQNTADVEDYIYNQILFNSPEKSGAFRANHNRTSGKPNTDFDKNKTSSTEPPPSGAKDFQDLYIANGAPYAERLEHGHSQQAPAGVYGVAHNSAKQKYGL